MAFYTGSGLNVTNQFGARETGAAAGAQSTLGMKRQLEVVLNAEGLNAAGNAYTFLPKVYLPKGAKIVAAYVVVKTAFTMTGTSPTILVGTKSSESTNGVVVSQANAASVGVVDITSTLAGTFASALTANTQIGVAFGGTSPVVTSAGSLRVLIDYIQVA